MDVFEAIRTRRSVRQFLDKPVDDECIRKVIEAGMLAPSAGNQQPWHFVVVRDREKLDSVPEYHPHSLMLRKAPVAIIVCGDKTGRPWPQYWDQDCSAAVQNMLLAARALGLGSVWAGIHPEEDRMAGFRKSFGIPEHILPFAIIPLGWPEGAFSSADRFKADRIHLGVW